MSLGIQQQNSNPNHRTLTGFVTKLVGDGAIYGFINDEIFFQQTKVAGGRPASVGDQVFAECEYSANLPIKWNATSVEIINKASVNSTANPDSSTPDQGSFNPLKSAPTYQLHREQRQLQQQQQQSQEPNPSDQRPQTRLLPDVKSGGEFHLASQDPRAGGRLLANSMQCLNQQETPQTLQTPMGPFNFAFTPQLGPSFVQQTQFVAPPYLAQQPHGAPPGNILPHQQLLPHGGTPPPSQIHQGGQQSQRLNTQSGGGRYNNDKPDNRQNNRGKGQNRSENKFNDRPRSDDREGSLTRQSKLSKDNRAIGKREDNTSIKVTSHSSGPSFDRGSKSSIPRRHYDVQNIPKTNIMTNINTHNIRLRCPSTVHVPSDLKEIIVNKHFRLDLRTLPKPLNFSIEPHKATSTPQEERDETPKDDVGESIAASSVSSDPSVSDKLDSKNTATETISSKLDSKLNHKYGIKLLLISIPDFHNIYHQVFNTNQDDGTPKPAGHGLDDVLKLLCYKGVNNGFSLVGGKFDPSLDGFVPEVTNKFERNERQPDLIATCKRIAFEQIGLDLSQCASWTLLSTFIYNNRSDYFSPKASVEYSYIYIPHLWTIKSDKFDDNIMTNKLVNGTGGDTKGFQEDESNLTNIQIEGPNKIDKTLDQLINLSDEDLKSELFKFNIEHEDSATREDLITLLRNHLSRPKEELTEASDPQPESTTTGQNDELKSQHTETDVQLEESQLEEGEVISSAGASDCEIEQDDETHTAKRKLPDEDKPIGGNLKKPCISKELKVELMKDAFIVRSRDQQLHLNLVPLYETHQPAKYDQFELSVASNILKESLVQHFSEYILTTLVEDSKFRRKDPSNASSVTTYSSSNSQDTPSDTNNNTKSASKSNDVKFDALGEVTREYPSSRYINLAFSYFDINQTGYIQYEDLLKLFTNTGLTISKRAMISLIGEGEKFNYRTLADLSPQLQATYIYELPEQFYSLFSSEMDRNLKQESKEGIEGDAMIQFKGQTYDLNKLIQQARDTEALRVSLVDRFNFAIENSDKQAEEIHVLEVSRNSLAKAIKAQNDEICELKRERDSLKKKVRYIIGSIGLRIFHPQYQSNSISLPTRLKVLERASKEPSPHSQILSRTINDSRAEASKFFHI